MNVQVNELKKHLLSKELEEKEEKMVNELEMSEVEWKKLEARIELAKNEFEEFICRNEEVEAKNE
jgi:hypothetical protein